MADLEFITWPPPSGTKVLAQSFVDGYAQAVVLADENSDAVALPSPARVKVTPTIDTAAYAAGDTMTSADLDFVGAGASGIITAVTLIDRDDLTHGASDGQLRVDVFSGAVDPGTLNAAYAITDDTEASKFLGSIDSRQGGPARDGTWTDLGPTKAITIPTWVPYTTADGDTLMVTLYSIGAWGGTPTASGLDVILHMHRD